MTAIVEYFAEDAIVGWVVSEPKQSSEEGVKLVVNGRLITTSIPNHPIDVASDHECRRFRINLARPGGSPNIWDFLTIGDKIEIIFQGEIVPIHNIGTHFSVAKSGSRNIEELIDKLDSGYIFNELGGLQLSRLQDEGWKRDVMSLYRDIEVFFKHRKMQVFPGYGTLLGTIREKNFIGHDHDFDLMYFSKLRDPYQVVGELIELGLELIKAGYYVNPKPEGISVRRVVNDQPVWPHVDIFHSFFDEDGRFHPGFGQAGPHVYNYEEFSEQFEDAVLDSCIVQVPRNPEILVEQLYGGSWRIPDKGFNWSKDYTFHEKRLQLSGWQQNILYWENFYARFKPKGSSRFSKFVKQRLHEDDTVIDIGCGAGQDSIFFGKTGFRTFGVDQSDVAMTSAQKHANEIGLEGVLRFEAIDVSKSEAVRKLLEQVDPNSRIAIYARFFFHSIDEAAESRIVKALGDNLRSQDVLFAEFRTKKDENIKKVYGGHRRRFVDVDKLIEKLESQGQFEILIRQEGNGFSPFQGEDPVLCRLVARKR